MTTEEKAKAYDKALERAQQIHDADRVSGIELTVCETIFPELAESEDERIRQWIIDDIRYNINNESLNNSEYKIQAEKAIAWLEKQSEQKPVEQKPTEESNETAYIRLMLEDIITLCNETSSGNVSHKIATIKGNTKKALDCLVEQKPVEWSDEDKEKFLECCSIIKQWQDKQDDYYFEKKFDYADWLKSLKDRVLPKPEWSEEDELCINYILCNCMNYAEAKGYVKSACNEELHQKAKDWLKYLRPQKQCSFIATEEELAVAKKDAFNEALDKIEYHSGEPTFEDGWYAALKYVRQRQWKPSEEQMEALKKASYCQDSVISKVLFLLYNDLKAL